MNAGCGNCAATTEPLTEGLCPTCRTIEAVTSPIGEVPRNVRSTVAPTNGHPPVPEPTIELGELLDELAGFVRRFVVMSTAQCDAAALWIAHTRCFDASEQTPYLAISSAEKRSGKTRLLEVLELLVARPWLTGRVTAAVLARKVDAEKPTLLLDESDAAFNGDKEYAEALRGLLNTGHRRGGKSTVCVGQGAEMGYKDFSTYCPKAIAGIGRLPDTVADRSLPIRLERRAPGETAERFRRRDAELEALPLVAVLEQLAGLVSVLEDARPDLPAELDDRAQDAAEPLLAIADRAGRDWPKRARRALVELHGGREIEDESSGVRLLDDIRAVFGDDDRITTTVLLDRLTELEESPWGEWFGKPLTSRGLSRLLKPYTIKSRAIRVDEKVSRGFLREQFERSWAQYLPPKVQQRYNPHSNAENGESESATNTSVLRIENRRNPAPQAECNAVADSDAQKAGLGGCAAHPDDPRTGCRYCEGRS